MQIVPWVPEVSFSLRATELSNKAAKASHEVILQTSTTCSDAPHHWRARRPLASRVCGLFPIRNVYNVMHLWICPPPKILAFGNPLPLGIYINLLWGGYRYFLELHIGQLLVICGKPVGYPVD